MNFITTLASVEDQGRPPISFLQELVGWAQTVPDEIFAPNDEPFDVMPRLLPKLGTNLAARDMVPNYVWDNLLHRKTAIMELMRCHAGMESHWNWKEGVDRTNKRSLENKTGEEAGIFQCSFDSEHLSHDAMRSFAEENDILTPEKFIFAMKDSDTLALEYYARLVRISYLWAGPLKRTSGDSVYQWLSSAARKEFAELLKSA